MTTTLAVAVWASVSTSHAGKSLAIGEHAASPGSAVPVAVTMADATGLAAAAFMVNFDPDLLTLMNVTTGSLGSAFALEYKLEAGRVAVALVRDEALTAGSGTLVNLHFTVNAGAIPGMTAPLAIADGAASGQYAVDFSWSEGAVHSNGVVNVVSMPATDTDGDGLPDWWEELYFQGATLADPAVDSDGDGMTNGQEFVARTNPRDINSVLRVTAAAFESGGFKVRFPTVSGVVYRLLRSEDLNTWTPVGPDIPGTDATREAIDPSPMNPDARYYRILVVR